MENLVSSKKIQRLLKMKGNSRLGVKDEITEKLLNLPKFAGITLEFLESKRRGLEGGNWFEYNALFRIPKISDTCEYLSYAFGVLKNIMEELKDLEINSIGIEEVDPGESGSYYILFYILKDE